MKLTLMNGSKRDFGMDYYQMIEPVNPHQPGSPSKIHFADRAFTVKESPSKIWDMLTEKRKRVA